jgi:hypothetical protein
MYIPHVFFLTFGPEFRPRWWVFSGFIFDDVTSQFQAITFSNSDLSGGNLGKSSFLDFMISLASDEKTSKTQVGVQL